MARTLLPRTIDGCHALIQKLDKELKREKLVGEAASEALHKWQNECAVVLSNKDMEMREKCKYCQRGIVRK